MSELKNCPFCENTALSLNTSPDIGGTRIECDACDCKGGTGICVDDAVKKWNTRADQWRPIETAPKDGIRIILGHRDAFTTTGRFYPSEPDQQDSMGHDAGFMDDDFDVYFPSRSFGNPKYRKEASQPTHWQPLPEPPSPQQVQGD